MSMTGDNQAVLWVLRILSAIVLLAIGWIHLFLVFEGVGGVLGVLFVLQAIAGLVLAIGMLILHGRLLSIATVLSLLFVIASLAALLHYIGARAVSRCETWDFTLVIPTVIVESIGVVVLAITTVVVLRTPRAA